MFLLTSDPAAAQFMRLLLGLAIQKVDTALWTGAEMEQHQTEATGSVLPPGWRGAPGQGSNEAENLLAVI